MAKPTGPALSLLAKPTRAPRTTGSASTWPSHLSSSTWTTGTCRHQRGRVAPIGFGVDDWILFLKKIKRACYFQNLIILAYYFKKISTKLGLSSNLFYFVPSHKGRPQVTPTGCSPYRGERTASRKHKNPVWPFGSIQPPPSYLVTVLFFLPHPVAASTLGSPLPPPARMAALLRTAAALTPPPSPARDFPRRPCAASLACSRRAPARPLRAQLLTARRAPGHAASRLRRLGATDAEEAARTATQVMFRAPIPIPCRA